MGRERGCGLSLVDRGSWSCPYRGGQKQLEPSGWEDTAVGAPVQPVHQLTALEPQPDLPLSPLHRVAGVDDVPGSGTECKGKASGCSPEFLWQSREAS